MSIIYYLLKENQKSHWHRLTKNEILHFYDGQPLNVNIYEDGINTSTIFLEMIGIIIKICTWLFKLDRGLV